MICLLNFEPSMAHCSLFVLVFFGHQNALKYARLAWQEAQSAPNSPNTLVENALLQWRSSAQHFYANRILCQFYYTRESESNDRSEQLKQLAKKIVWCNAQLDLVTSSQDSRNVDNEVLSVGDSSGSSDSDEAETTAVDHAMKRRVLDKKERELQHSVFKTQFLEDLSHVLCAEKEDVFVWDAVIDDKRFPDTEVRLFSQIKKHPLSTVDDASANFRKQMALMLGSWPTRFLDCLETRIS